MRRLGARQRLYLKRLYQEGGLIEPVAPDVVKVLAGLEQRGWVENDDGVWVLTSAGVAAAERRMRAYS